MIRKITIYTAAVLTLSLLSIFLVSTTASAEKGPHEGTFTTTTASCAGCHRAHTASGSKLLNNPTQYGLCISCHGGHGANTNVVDGVYIGNQQGINGFGLKGGGFINAKMDTDVDGYLVGENVTSKHTIGGVYPDPNPIVWGSGSPNAAAYPGETLTGYLECGSCHNPHGNGKYRLLRPDPTGILVTDNATANVTVTYTTDSYTITYDSDNYSDLSGYDSSVLAQMSDWCGQCHTRYMAGVGDGHLDSGDFIFAYRHITDGGTFIGECLNCHVAHGTSATMIGHAANSSYIQWPNAESVDWQDTDYDEGDYSRLLRIDNRGVCMQCHAVDVNQ